MPENYDVPSPGDPGWAPDAAVAAQLRDMIAAAQLLPEYKEALDTARDESFERGEELARKNAQIEELEGGLRMMGDDLAGKNERVAHLEEVVLDLQREVARLAPFEQAHQAALTFLAESKALQKKFSAEVVTADTSRRLRRAPAVVGLDERVKGA